MIGVLFRKMKVFNFKHREDFGHDFYFTFFKVGRWALLQLCVYTAEYGRRFPYLNITMGAGRLFEVCFSFWKVGFNFEFICKSWFQ